MTHIFEMDRFKFKIESLNFIRDIQNFILSQIGFRKI